VVHVALEEFDEDLPDLLDQSSTWGGVLIERDDDGPVGKLLARLGRKCSAEKLNALAYANMAAAIGGFSNLWLKCTTMLVWVSLSGGEKAENEFAKPGTYFVVLLTIGSLIAQLYVLNLGLALHEAITIVPIYQGLFLLNTGLIGGIYFEEFDTLSPAGAVFFPLGMLIIMLGLFVLTSREKLVIVDPTSPRCTSEEPHEYVGMEPSDDEPHKEHV